MAKKGVVLYSVGCGLSGNVMEFFMAIAFKTGGQYVPLSNASKLADVIIGGAQEEVSLEKLMAEVDEEVQKDLKAKKVIDEEELSRRIHEKMKLKGARAIQIKRKNKQVGEISRRAKIMSKLRTFPDMRDFPTEGAYITDRSLKYGGGSIFVTFVDTLHSSISTNVLPSQIKKHGPYLSFIRVNPQ